MKKISKILALVVALTMLMSVSAFAATKTLVTGTNGKTIDLSFAFTDTSANPITEVANGSTFIIQVNFAGNSGDPDDTDNLGMCGYNVFVNYDNTKVQFTNKQAGLQVTANPTANATFADGVAYYTAAFESGALNDADWVIYEEGNLFRIRAKALADLTEADLAGLVEFSEGVSATERTKVIDQDKAEYTITVPAAEEPAPVKTPGEAVAAKTTLETAEATFDNVAIYEIKWPVSANAVYGVSVNNVDKDLAPGVAITGSGNVEYVLAFFNIADANVLEVIPYTYQ